MKAMLAIVCSLLLAGTLFVPAQAQSACAGRVARKSCRCCDTGSCCGAKTSSEPQPASAVPTFSTSSSQFPALAPRQVAWSLLPPVQSGGTIARWDAPSFASELPAYARDCARLL